MPVPAVLSQAISDTDAFLTKTRHAQDAIENSLLLGRRFLKVARQAPDASIAYCHLAGPSKPSENYVIRYLLLLAILCHRGQLNEHFAQQLIAATALTSLLRQRSRQHLLGEIKTRLARPGLSHWLPLLSMCRRASSAQRMRVLGEPSLNLGERYILVAGIFALALPKHAMGDVLSLMLRVCHPFYRNELFHFWSFPCQLSPGSHAIYQGQRTLILASQSAQRAIWLPTHDKPYRWVNTSALRSASSPDTVSFNHWLEHHQTLTTALPVSQHRSWPFSPAFPVQYPPSSLTAIIDLLENPDVEISELTDSVNSEPHFARVLKQAATLDNRLNIRVTEVKQAVMTYGLERVGDILIQQALLQRLAQRQFPLEQVSKQLCQIVALLAQQIVLHSDTKMSPQRAGLMATFMMAPLFTLPRLKSAHTLPLGTKRFHDINHLLSFEMSQPLSELSIALMRGWHQRAEHQAVMKYSGKMPDEVSRSLRQVYCVLSLALLYGRTWLYPPGESCPDTISFERAALATIGVSSETILLIKNDIMAELYCALPR